MAFDSFLANLQCGHETREGRDSICGDWVYNRKGVPKMLPCEAHHLVSACDQTVWSGHMARSISFSQPGEARADLGRYI